jgi:hypothetical protein
MQSQDIKKQQMLNMIDRQHREYSELSGLIEIDQFHKIMRKNGL